ncbi:MAG: LysM domain-containing protein [Chloroflexi bacterium]|nr:LysM domain-containing protein [Chloroflexota bacterium]
MKKLMISIAVLFFLTCWRGIYGTGQNTATVLNIAPISIVATINSRDEQIESVKTLATPTVENKPVESIAIKITAEPRYDFGNPAGCSQGNQTLSSAEMLANVQKELGDEYNLSERRQAYVWNGGLGVTVDARDDPFVFEFAFNEFQHPLTYRGDRVITIFLTQGFVVWLRAYQGNFRLLAIPMIPVVMESPWAQYVSAYWQKNGLPGDETIYPVMKKLPCHWVIDQGYVSNEILQDMFSLPWNLPDYMAAGQLYLAPTCKEAYQVSREKIGYSDASTMCGPLSWTIIRDVNGFPYRIGSWYATANAFTAANPKWNGQPWGTFDPETFTLIHTDDALPGYDFQKCGNLYQGDLVYSYALMFYDPNDQRFDHIFLVAGVDENGSRLAISNMVQNSPHKDCSISEVVLYTPGDRETGVINHEWNGFGFGKTGSSGFDIFRWDWVTYQNGGKALDYTVRWGDTCETIAFDWKISPDQLAAANHLTLDAALTPGDILTLPEP